MSPPELWNVVWDNQLSLRSCFATSAASAEPLVDSDSGHGKTDLLAEHVDPWSDKYENIPERVTYVDLNGMNLVCLVDVGANHRFWTICYCRDM